MPIIFFSENELNALIDGELRIPCHKIVLRSSIKGTAPLVEAPGELFFAETGAIVARIFTINLDAVHPFAPSKTSHQAGKIYEKNELYSLTAIDRNNRIWRANHLIIDLFEPPCIELPIHRITITTRREKEDVPFVIVDTPINCYFRGSVDVPCNAGTEILKKVAGEDRLSSSHWNAAKSSSNDTHFMYLNTKRYWELSATSSKPVNWHIGESVVQAISFCLGNVLEPRMVHRSGKTGREAVRIRSEDRSRITRPLQAPCSRWYPAKHDPFWRLFASFFEYCQRQPSNPRWSRSFRVFYDMVQSRSAGIDALALSLGVGLEAVVRHFQEDLLKANAEEEQKLDDAIAKVKEYDGLSSELKNRIAGAVKGFKAKSPETALRALVKKGVLAAAEVDSWRYIRHKSAHGEDTSELELQAILTKIDACLTAFYKVIFDAIGYAGDYTDYGEAGWPTKVFPGKQ